MKFQSVKGMDDLFSPEIERWQVLEEKTRTFFEAYGFREVRTPILESTELFTRSIGEATDIVHKEMYTFKDRGDRSLTLRPEMTASVVRSALEHSLIKPNEPLFVYYMGQMFRAERPQAGRKRQFHQIGVETLNTHSAINDAELILMVSHFLKWIGLNKFVIKLNHLGSKEDREKFKSELRLYFSNIKGKVASGILCPDCMFRLEQNVLRILDCKNESCQPALAKAPKLKLSEQPQKEFDQVVKILKDDNAPILIESKLVRGLDYYTGLVFEVTAEGLGSQDAILAGGRYDALIHELGGPNAGASGFSIGVERLLLALKDAGVELENEILADTVYVAAIVDNEESCAFYRKVAQALVKAKKRAHFSFSKGSLSSHLGRASKMKAGFALIVGEDEWKQGEVSVKSLGTGIQKRMKPEALAQELKGF